MKKVLAIAVILLSALMFVQMAATETVSAFDPQSLVCKWESAIPGEGWKAVFQGREVSGDLFVKIKKVEKNKAWGEIYIAGRQNYHNQWWKFEAALSEINDGAALDFKVSTFIFVHLEARGDRMTGTGMATASAAFFLKKAASCGN